MTFCTPLFISHNHLQGLCKAGTHANMHRAQGRGTLHEGIVHSRTHTHTKGNLDEPVPLEEPYEQAEPQTHQKNQKNTS